MILQLWDPKNTFAIKLVHRCSNGKSLNSLNFAHNLRVRIFQSNFRSELSAFLNPTEQSGLQTIIFVLIQWAQQISAGPWYVRVAQLSICSAHKEQLTAKTALKFFRKYHYLLILRKIQTVQRFFILSSKLKLKMKSFLGSLSCMYV